VEDRTADVEKLMTKSANQTEIVCIENGLVLLWKLEGYDWMQAITT
jgi:hypothetical protein